MNRTLILQEDDTAPDALQYFDLAMMHKVGFSRLEMEALGNRSDSVDMGCLNYEYKGYFLEYCGDYPYHQLYKLEKL